MNLADRLTKEARARLKSHQAVYNKEMAALKKQFDERKRNEAKQQALKAAVDKKHFQAAEAKIAQK